MAIVKSISAWLRTALSRIRKPNPVIVREMRARMRGPRAFWFLTGYLVALGLLAYGLYRITMVSIQYSFGFGSAPQSAVIGQILFVGLAFIELLFICFVTPALTAGAISGEVDRRTYDMLMATPLSPSRIVIGKLVASLTYALLLILAAIPLSSIIFLFGGIALRDVAQAIGLMVVVTLTYGALGIFFSALIRRTAWATILTYVVVLALTIGTIFVWVFVSAVNEGQPMAPLSILYANPLIAMASAIISPQAALARYGGSAELFQLLTLGDSIHQGPSRPIWQYTVGLYLTLTVILTVLTTHLVKPVRRWHLDRQSLFRLLALLLLLAIGLVILFGTNIASTGWHTTNHQEIVPTPLPIIAPVAPEIMIEEFKEGNEASEGVPSPTPETSQDMSVP